jgi:uncharacterized membrane protein YhaH (DUF805 family)
MHILRILFGWRGRIDRTTYFSVIGLVSVLSGADMLVNFLVSTASPSGGIVMTIASLPLWAWCSLAVTVKRLRDMGRSPGLAFLPIGLIALTVIVMASSLLSAISINSGAGVIAAFLGGGLVLVIASLIAFGMMLWMVFAGSSPHGVGERLTLYGCDVAERAGDAARDHRLEAALNNALNARAAAPALALASPSRPSGLPQRPGAPAGGFGCRR